MRAPSVAVVIAVKDGAATIGATLASLVAQEHRPDQVVVVDDGSRDGTMGVVGSWMARLPITVVTNEVNRGLGAARRGGFEKVTTDLVAILDADDVALPDHLSLLLRLHGQHGGIATAQGIKWVPGRALGRRPWIAAHPVPAPKEQLARLAVANFVFIASLISLADHDRAGGFRDLRGRGEGCEDWDLWLRMVRQGCVVRPAPVPSVLYRLRPDSLSAGDRTLEAEVQVLRSFLEDEDLPPAVRAAGEVGLRQRRARVALRTAYGLAAQRRLWSARRAALPGLRGSPFHASRSLALILAPARVDRVRQRTLSSADAVVNR